MPELPRFVGGAVGYAGYDVIRYYENLPAAPPDDRSLPDLSFGLYDTMVVFDHVQKLIRIVTHAAVENEGVEPAYATACRRIEEVAALLTQEQKIELDSLAPRGSAPPQYTSSTTREQFEQHVDRCREYIRAGDIFQVVLSQRLCVETTTDPFDIYRALRVVNPSPFMFYLKSPQVTLVGSSPEILCRVEDGVVTNRPAGRYPARADRTDAEDMGLEKELLADPKERAEHVMLVDLGRNDVGRVAQPGTIRLDELMTVERYSHVMHICSNVSGRLAPGRTAFDALRATLPVGTVSGAPKIRAMEIIDELEPTRRGPYAGAVGYFDFAGNMDTCIALRTLVITEGRDSRRRVYAQGRCRRGGRLGAIPGVRRDDQQGPEHAAGNRGGGLVVGGVMKAAAGGRRRARFRAALACCCWSFCWPVVGAAAQAPASQPAGALQPPVVDLQHFEPTLRSPDYRGNVTRPWHSPTRRPPGAGWGRSLPFMGWRTRHGFVSIGPRHWTGTTCAGRIWRAGSCRAPGGTRRSVICDARWNWRRIT